jgi:hypothetical protein
LLRDGHPGDEAVRADGPAVLSQEVLDQGHADGQCESRAITAAGIPAARRPPASGEDAGHVERDEDTVRRPGQRCRWPRELAMRYTTPTGRKALGATQRREAVSGAPRRGGRGKEQRG